MSKQANIRLSDELFERLQYLASSTGRTATYYIREAIEQHLDDIEDVYLAETALLNLRKGKDEILTSEDFWADVEN
jgi:RHH-type rel operon transcriptional repressor/antitoxin RelB